jgi:hypothetical protein
MEAKRLLSPKYILIALFVLQLTACAMMAEDQPIG